MAESNAPLKRSIGLSGIIRWLMAVTAMIAISAGFASGRNTLAIAGMVFLVAAVALGYWRAHRRTGAADAPQTGPPA